ncbi:MAG: polysaccharide deacetylase family protein [Candidatus Omnitrophota bacterium]
MKSLCRRTLSTLAFISQKITRRIYPSLRGVRIFNYHHVAKAEFAKSASSVSIDAFTEQMKYLHDAGYTTIYPEDIFKVRDLPKKPVVITFDDGYLDNYEYAFPVLMEFGFRALIFLITDFMDSVYNEAPMLSWHKIREMKKSGIKFGSHTKTHRVLTELKEDEIKDELSLSRACIEDKIGEKVTDFCYPKGVFNDRIRALVKESGYLCACVTLAGENNKGSDAYLLRRTWISPKDTLFDFKTKISGAYDFVYNILESKKMY